MSAPTSRRAAVNERLTTGFVVGLASTLRELFELLGQGDDSLEAVRFELDRVGSTAGSLGLDAIQAATTQALADLRGEFSRSTVLAPVVRAARQAGSVSPFAPIALIGDERITSGVQLQDDGSCEPVLAFTSVEHLHDSLGVRWPQAIILPAALAHQVPELRELYDAQVYVYGASRDAAGRLAAARVGAHGFVSEPLVLSELLSQVRYAASEALRSRLVALVGPEDWSAELAIVLEGLGVDVHRSHDFLGVSAVLHGIYPEAVVLGPGDAEDQAQALRVMRQHNGRSHIALLAVGSSSLYEAGADDVLSSLEDVAPRVLQRLERFRDFRRDRDDLTHIPNRAGVLESLQQFAAWSERAAQPLSVALVLAEGLTEATEQHGREAGNACRRHLAAALERGLRRVDLVGTLGGDLFIAGLVRCEVSEAEKRMAQIRKTWESRVHADRRLREVTLSIGVADTLAGTEGLMTRAQTALEQVRSAVRP
jgi:diguanylate cyclase (GGDEF)-like protein